MSNPLNITVEEIIEQASDPIGGGPYTGDKLRKAKRDLELVMIELVNDGVPLSLVSEITFSGSNGTHTFDSNVKDVIDIVDTSDNIVTTLTQVDLPTFNRFNVSEITGRPTQFATHKKTDATEVRFYPAPDKSYTWRAFVDLDPSQIGGYDDTLAVRSTFLPAIISGLTYRLAIRQPELDMAVKQGAKDQWEDLRERALDADRDKSSMFIRPSRRRKW